MPVEHTAARDLYLRHTDTSGHSYVMEHRVWDVDTFLAARQAEAKKLNAEVKGDGPRKAGVQQITEDQYRKERKAQR